MRCTPAVQLRSAAFVALAIGFLALPAAAQTACTRTGDAAAVTVTCSGDQSGGIDESDILGATSQGGAPATFPGTGTPPTPSARDITVRVRELTPNPGAPATPGNGIDLSLRGIAGTIPPPIRSAPELGAFTLDVDLGSLRITPGATTQDRAVTAIPLLPDATVLDLSVSNAERTSLFVRLRGDFRATGSPSGTIRVANSTVLGPDESSGAIDLAIRAGSRVQGPVDSALSAVSASAQRGAVTVRLEPGVSVIGTSVGSLSRFNGDGIRVTTRTRASGNRPGDVRVIVAGGTATDGAGNPIPNVQIDALGGIGIFARAQANSAQNFLEPGAVAVTTGESSYILTTRESSAGIAARSTGKDIDVAVAGRVETRGGFSQDLSARARSGTIVESFGIYAETRRAPEVLVTIQNTGSVITAGERADAIRLITRGQPVAQNPGASSPGPSTLRAVVAGTVRTAGNNAAGLRASADDDDPMTTAVGDIALTVAAGATIETRGMAAHGILAETEQGDVMVTVAGTVRTGTTDAPGTPTRGTDAQGILAQTEGGDVTIQVMGSVSTAGATAAAVAAVVDDGDFMTAATGDITVGVAAGATLETRGQLAPGISAETESGVVAITTAGAIEIRGSGGNAIVAVSRDGDPADAWGVDVEVAGAVTTRGEDSHGVRVIVRGADNDARVRVSASGGIETGAPGAAGGRGIFVSGEPAANQRSDLRIEIDGPVTSYNDNAAVWAHTATQLVPGTMQRVAARGDVTVLTTAPVVGHLAGTDGIDAETGDGVVTIRTAGSVTTRGAGGNAIRAVTGDGTVAITVGGGRVFAAAAAATRAAAVRAQAPLGPDQRLFLTVARDGAVEGELAVAFAGGSDAAADPNRILVQSGGSLIGALALGAGADLLENRGLLALQGSSQFGAGVGVDRFLQAGQFEPGGVGRVETVSLWGLETVEFAPGGVVVIDVDGMGAGARTDRIVFGAETSGGTGPSVTLGGEVQIREMPGRRSFRTGETSFPILGADGGLSGVGNLRLATTSTGGVIRRLYRLVGEDGGTELRLVQVTEGSFVCPDGDRNIRAVGAELDRLASLAELPEEFESLLSGLGDLPKGGPYERAVNLLHAEPYDALLQGSWHAERALVDALWEGCGGTPGEGGYCAFGGLHGRSLDRVGEAANADFEELALGPRGGVSRHLGELGGRSWQLRVGVAYEALDLEWREGARGRGDRLLGGVALHSRSPGGVGPGPFFGGLDIGLALAGGGAWFETERAVDRLGIAHAEAEPELTFLGGHGRLLYRLGRAPQELGWYAEFGLEGSAVALWLESFSEEEETAGVLRLRVAEARELVTTVRPQLGLGGSWQWGELRVAPRARLGFSYAVGGADTPYRARWIEAPSPPGRGFTTWGDRENWLIEASGGLAVTLREQISLRLDYTGRVSPDGTTRSHEGQLRAELRF